MAKYTVKMGCGHEQVVNLLGKSADRDRKIEWMESCGKCAECLAAEREAERAAEAEKAAANKSEAGLPDLEGSEKQIAWAERIRYEVVKKNESKQCADRVGTDWALANFTKAAYWIDRHDDNYIIAYEGFDAYLESNGYFENDDTEEQRQNRTKLARFALSIINADDREKTQYLVKNASNAEIEIIINAKENIKAATAVRDKYFNQMK